MSSQFPYVRCPSCGGSFNTETTPQPADSAQQPRLDVRAVVLRSWKDIASYLACGVRTAQRWEHDLGMPVRWVGQNDHTAVIAFPQEIEAWLRNTRVGVQTKRDPHSTPSPAPRATSARAEVPLTDDGACADGIELVTRDSGGGGAKDEFAAGAE